MRLFIDQDVFQVTVRFLQKLDHDVLTAKDAGLATAPDQALLEFAINEQRILVTRDKGFGALVFLKSNNCGVILLRVDPATIDVVHDELAIVFSMHNEETLAKHFVVAEPGQHRMRTQLFNRT